MAIRHVLIANRGEIALRIARSARALGYRTTAIYSEADAGSPHVAAADQAIAIGPAPVSQSYLNLERVLAAARKAGADALHPGYGLLSENAELARRCADAGIVFVGPSARCIAQMGDKAAARAQARAAGVPCVPGYDGDSQHEADFIAAAAELGYPLMIKAAAGGGGRGMRRVCSERELHDELPRARAEAEAAFGDGRLLLERVIEQARHVEVQLLADAHAHALHLGERDCSLQRRFQKVIEESPSPAVGDALRARLGDAALSLARAAGYVGAGTVEFLLAATGEFYFLEMNTRLQVEHAVTELVTGIDLVAEQLRIADGQPLSFSQQDVVMEGHAVEARLYAEDPTAGFLPHTGQVRRFRAPGGAGVRIDHALAEGLLVSAHYDPMLAKIIAHGRDRGEALRRLDAALRDSVLLGVRHNRDFLRRVLAHPDFAAGAVDTAWLAGAGAALCARPGVDSRDLAAAALALMLREAGSRDFGELLGFANAQPIAFPFALADGEASHSMQLRCLGNAFEALVEGTRHEITLSLWDAQEGQLRLTCDGLDRRYAVAFDGDRIELDGGLHLVLHDRTRWSAAAESESGSGRVTSSMDGLVAELLVGAGDRVERDQTLLLLEAMKLQHAISADVTGRITHLAVSKGDQVKVGQLLLEIEEGRT